MPQVPCRELRDGDVAAALVGWKKREEQQANLGDEVT